MTLFLRRTLPLAITFLLGVAAAIQYYIPHPISEGALTQMSVWLRIMLGFAMVLGIASLIGFAVVLTRVDTAFAGRAYAAYGGIYIAASLFWLWIVEGQRPSGSDLLGAGVALIGALLIIGFAPKAQ